MSSPFELGNVFIRLMEEVTGGEGESVAVCLTGRAGGVESVVGFWKRWEGTVRWCPQQFEAPLSERDAADALHLNRDFARYLHSQAEMSGRWFPVLP